jgi:hypothetical protein
LRELDEELTELWCAFEKAAEALGLSDEALRGAGHYHRWLAEFGDSVGTTEAAAVLGVSANHVRGLWEAGELAGYDARLGTVPVIRIYRASLRAFRRRRGPAHAAAASAGDAPGANGAAPRKQS